MSARTRRPAVLVLLLFLLCNLAKDIEFIYIQTDRTVLAENLFCKLFTIAVSFFALRRLAWRFSEIGFKREGLLRGMAYGFSLGIGTFAASYLAEFLVLRAMGRTPRLRLFITNFALSDQTVAGLSLSALVICVFGNIFNVWAEEGLFRGLLLKIGGEALSPARANLLQALLFGLWHVVTVVVWVRAGMLDIPSAVVFAFGYLVLAGALGYEWGLCAVLTGTLWTGVFEHFFNNFIGNALHMVTETGIDELQILRIALSNFLSLGIVVLAAGLRRRKAKNRIKIYGIKK